MQKLFHLREQVTCKRELDFFPVENFAFTFAAQFPLLLRHAQFSESSSQATS